MLILLTLFMWMEQNCFHQYINVLNKEPSCQSKLSSCSQSTWQIRTKKTNSKMKERCSISNSIISLTTTKNNILINDNSIHYLSFSALQFNVDSLVSYLDNLFVAAAVHLIHDSNSCSWHKRFTVEPEMIRLVIEEEKLEGNHIYQKCVHSTWLLLDKELDCNNQKVAGWSWQQHGSLLSDFFHHISPDFGSFFTSKIFTFKCKYYCPDFGRPIKVEKTPSTWQGSCLIVTE